MQTKMATVEDMPCSDKEEEQPPRSVLKSGSSTQGKKTLREKYMVDEEDDDQEIHQQQSHPFMQHSQRVYDDLSPRQHLPREQEDDEQDEQDEQDDEQDADFPDLHDESYRFHQVVQVRAAPRFADASEGVRTDHDLIVDGQLEKQLSYTLKSIGENQTAIDEEALSLDLLESDELKSGLIKHCQLTRLTPLQASIAKVIAKLSEGIWFVDDPSLHSIPQSTPAIATRKQLKHVRNVIAYAGPKSGKSLTAQIAAIIAQLAFQKAAKPSSTIKHCVVILYPTSADCIVSTKLLRKICSNVPNLQVSYVDEALAEMYLDEQDHDLLIPDILCTTPVVLSRFLEFKLMLADQIHTLVIDDLDLMVVGKASRNRDRGGFKYNPSFASSLDPQTAGPEFNDLVDVDEMTDSLEILFHHTLLPTAAIIAFASSKSNTLNDFVSTSWRLGQSPTIVESIHESMTMVVDAPQALDMKNVGNRMFAAGNYVDALQQYSMALRCRTLEKNTRAVLYSNRAAVRIKLGGKDNYEKAIEDGEKAKSLDPQYVKSYVRLKMAYELNKEYSKALENASKLREMDPSACSLVEISRLEEEAKKQEKAQMEDALQQLKGLGNTILGNFGLSMDSFKFEQDATTGSYNVKFQQ